MLKWWEGIYDHVFIALHPFFRIRKKLVEVTGLDKHSNYENWIESGDFADDFEDIVKHRGEPVSWHSVHMAVAPEVPEPTFFRAVWLLACSGFQERADIALQKKISTYCEKQRLQLPEDDSLSAILHPTVYRFLSALGAETVTVWDEFRDNSFTVPISVFAPEQPTYWLSRATTRNGVWAIHLANPGLLIGCQFDGTEAMIAMTENALKIAKPDDFFEGRYADSATYCDWLNPSDFFERDQ